MSEDSVSRSVGAPPPETSYATGSYYERPVLKESVWLWFIPAYFFAGGAAGAAQVLGAVAQATDRQGLRGLVKKCRWIATLGLAAGSAFLIADLGRPERFMNMLRVFRPTSAMNMGSWILATSGPLAGTSAMLADAEGFLGTIGDLAGMAAGPAGLPLSAYTAVLLSDTAVPVWQVPRQILPALFASSGMMTATGLLEMTSLEEDEASIVHRLGITAKLAEMASVVALEMKLAGAERVGRPLKEGVSGALWKAAKATTATSLGLAFVKGRRAQKLSGLMAAAGSLTMRFALHHAGKASARDPHATFEPQRLGKGGGRGDSKMVTS